MKTRLFYFLLALLAIVIAQPSANAQTVCENVSATIFKHPTQPHLLVIRFEDQSGAFVNYPSLNLLYEGEVIAAGETTLFQFPEVSYHLLEPELIIEEGEEYTFTIDIYAIFGTEYVCSFEWVGVPYAPEGCFDGLFTVSTSATVEQEVELVIRDEFDTVVLTQNIWVEFGNLSSSFPLCLPRACYTVSLEAVGSTFQANYLLTWNTEGQTWFSRLANQSEAFSAFELDLWEGCSFVKVNEVGAQQKTPDLFATLAHAGAEVYPLQSVDQPLRIRVYTISGALLEDSFGRSFTAPAIPGLYVIRAEHHNSQVMTQRMVVQ